MHEFQRKNDHKASLATFLSTPQAEVNTLFSNLTLQSFDPHTERGGVIRENITVQLPRSKNVQMTFSPEQRPYAAIAVDCLNKIAEGEILGSDRKTPSLEERITTEFTKSKEVHTTPFLTAIQVGITRTLDDFSYFHPNLLSALHGTFELAGAEGTESAVKAAIRLLKETEIVTSEDNIKSLLQKYLPSKEFIEMHDTDIDDGIQPFEVHCTGRSFGIKVVEKILLAARKINTSNATSVKEQLPVVKNGEIRTQLIEHIRILSKAATGD
jgi:hypothetical protein